MWHRPHFFQNITFSKQIWCFYTCRTVFYDEDVYLFLLMTLQTVVQLTPIFLLLEYESILSMDVFGVIKYFKTFSSTLFAWHSGFNGASSIA